MRTSQQIACIGVAFGLILAGLACEGGPEPKTEKPVADPGPGSAPPPLPPVAPRSRVKPATSRPAADASVGADGSPRVSFETSMGDFVVELNAAKAPITVKNFLVYVNEGHYDGTIFHRVMSNFMIQGGAFKEDMTKKNSHSPIKNEASNGLSNKRGTIAMARTGVVDSATDQFFINVKDNGRPVPSGGLDHGGTSPRIYGYAVFGKVTEGMDVIDEIRMVPVGTTRTPEGQPMQNVPREPVVILKASVISGATAE